MLGGPPASEDPPPLWEGPQRGAGGGGDGACLSSRQRQGGQQSRRRALRPSCWRGARGQEQESQPETRCPTQGTPKRTVPPSSPPAPAPYSRMSPPSSRDPPFPAAVPVAGGSQNSSLILPAEWGAASDTPGLSAGAHHAQPGPHAPAGEPRACQHPKRHLVKLGPSGYARCICLCWLSTGSLGTGDPCAKRHWCVRCLQGRRRGKLHRGGSG